MFDTKNLAAQSDVERKERAVYFYMQEKAQAGRSLAERIEDFSNHCIKPLQQDLQSLLIEYYEELKKAHDNLQKEIGRRFV